MVLIFHFKCTLKCRLEIVSIWTKKMLYYIQNSPAFSQFSDKLQADSMINTIVRVWYCLEMSVLPGSAGRNCYDLAEPCHDNFIQPCQITLVFKDSTI